MFVESAQWTLYGAVNFVPIMIKNHSVKIIITLSISPDENNNVERVLI